MDLNGLHHVTAVTREAEVNLDFYTRVLGLRLVKRTVNQDDVSAYHLFYADRVGTPGTDITFFDWSFVARNRRGTDSIVATAFRVNGQAALDYWAGRLADAGAQPSAIQPFAGREMLTFEDPEGQRLALVDDGGAPWEGVPWDGGDVPEAYGLRGFFAVLLSMPRIMALEPILTETLGFRQMGNHAPFYPDGGELTLYETGEGGPGRQLWVAAEPDAPFASLGAGGVHHLALRVPDDEAQLAWRERIHDAGLPVTEVIDRFYFKSIYFRVSRNILFEIATDGPGFAADEDPAALGETLALPPFLEPRRAEIEAGLRPIAPRPRA